MSNHGCHNRERWTEKTRYAWTYGEKWDDDERSTDRKAEREPESSSEHISSPVLNKQQEGVCLHPETCHSTTWLIFANSVFWFSSGHTGGRGGEERGQTARRKQRERIWTCRSWSQLYCKGNVLAGELPNIFTVIYTFICFDSLHCDSHMHLCYRRFSPGTWATVVFSCLHQIIFWLRNETIQIHKLNWSEVKWVNSCCVPGCSQIPIIPSLTFLQVGSLSCWVCCDWTSCLDAPQSCPLTGHPSCPFPVWSLHALPLGLLLYPRLAHGGLAASERFEVWLHIERESNQSG